MPRSAPYLLRWSTAAQRYELCEGRDQTILGLEVESPAWFSWVDQISSFAFHGSMGSYTARLERKARGGGYWYAYLREGDKVTKRYLGRSTDLTLSRLEQTAQLLIKHPPHAPSREERMGEHGAMPPFLSSPRLTASALERKPAMSSWLQRELLLATKVQRPRLRPATIHRTHLVDQLQQGMEGACMLLSAPAGFGKTTLLSAWLEASGTPVAWLSLEPEDNEPVHFLSYTIAALQTLDPSLGATTLALLHAPQPATPEKVMTVLINEISTASLSHFVLVLDDYHVITSELIHQALTFLLDHQPPHMHLVVATRADPPFPLTRLRARAQLTEVRAADLRFTHEETQSFFHTVMQIPLSSDEAVVLQNRTEGWIAGLQLAGLSLRGKTDVSNFLHAFTGSHRFVLDYLSEEVLSQQSMHVLEFLIQTCILDRLSGSLCGAVTNQENGQAMLEQLERTNMFVISLDDERQWYRYHHLFAEMLRSRLQHIQPSLVPTLHLRASTWYEQHSMLLEAVQHAFAVPDLERVAYLIEQAELQQPRLILPGQIQLMLDWFNALPDALVRSRPVLCVVHARFLQASHAHSEVIEARLRDAEESIAGHAEVARLVLGQVAFLRGVLALYRGDLERCIMLSRQTLDLWPQKGETWHLAALIGTLRSYLLSGDATIVMEQQLEEMVNLARSASMFTSSSGFYLLARFQTMQGRLHQAERTYMAFVQTVGHNDLQVIVGGPAYYFGLGNIHREWNNLMTAEQFLTEGLEIVRNTWAISADVVTLGYIALADLHRAQGDYQQALALLREYGHVAQLRNFVPVLLSWGRAAQVEVELAQGNLTAAIHWAEGISLSQASNLSYPREREYLALVRVRIAQGREHPTGPFLSEALTLLDRLLQDAEEKARMHSALEILILRALAFHAQNSTPQALATLEQALTLAEPEGYIRLFIDEGRPMITLLLMLQEQKMGSKTYLQTLLAASGEYGQNGNEGTTPLLKNRSPIQQPLLDPLSQRELEILHLVAEGASNDEIAERLVIAVSTVKRHVSNIFGKLTVSNRTQAVARARELGLL